MEVLCTLQSVIFSYLTTRNRTALHENTIPLHDKQDSTSELHGWLTKFSCRLLSWICQSTNGLVKIRLRLGLRLWLDGDTTMFCIERYNVQLPLFNSKICDMGDL